jgi:5-methylcytosine-specific restriction endonuclease McrA
VREIMEEQRKVNIDSPRVLVLNAGYQALGIATVRRAISLTMAGYAEVLEESGEYLHTPSTLYPVPAVVRLNKMVRPRLHKIRLKRRNVFKRDSYVCQYCGRPTHDLTLDHVMPRSRGGHTSWDNLVSACFSCNHRKADRTPDEAGMKLMRKPARPNHAIWLDILEVPEGWRGYFNG